jgi:hypothetical protein
MTTNANETVRELDHRVSDGIEVTLFWRPEDDRAIVAVSDTKTGDSFTLEVAPDQRPLDVFHHPYAYAPDSVLTRPGGELAPAG